MNITATYYLDVTSSWCFWAEPAWAELKAQYAGRPVEFTWKIALLDEAALPKSHEQVEWFYRRSGMVMRSPFMLNANWHDPALKEYLAPNCVAEAAKDFKVTDDRGRLALANAALRDGLKIGTWEIAAQVAAKATGLEVSGLLAKAQSP